MTQVSDEDFYELFNVADEIWPGTVPMTLADLDPAMVARARQTAETLGLSWPPYLPELEEELNDRRSNERG